MAEITAEELLARYTAGEKDFRGADLSSIDLSGSELRSIDLSRTNLTGANLTGINWRRICLTGAELSDANLTNASITKGLMSATSFSANGAEFLKCTMLGCSIVDSLENTTIRGCDLIGGTFDKALIKNVKFINSRMRGCLFEAGIENVEFIRCDLSGSLFTGSVLRSVLVEDSEFRGVTFYEGDLIDCQFIKSNLIGVIYREMNLTREVIAGGTILKTTTFQEAILNDGKIISYP